MDATVVIHVLGGEIHEYENSNFECREGWLVINGPSRVPIAAYAQHRVYRVYYKP